MARYFVLSTDALTSEEEKALNEQIKAKFGWWHWLPNFWLLRSNSGSYSAADIRDIFHEINTTKRCMVLEVEPKTWSAMTRPDAAGNDMAGWIKKNWGT